MSHPPNFQHTTWNTPGPWNRPVGTDLWNHTIGTRMSLERIYFVGTGYTGLLEQDQQTIAVNIGDVSRVSCGYMNDRTPVVCLHSATGMLLAALPWPESVRSDDEAVRWWLAAAAKLAASATPW